MTKKKTETSPNWGGKRDNQMGRPPIAGETQERHNLTCPAEVWAWLQAYGDGNAAEGLRRLYAEHQMDRTINFGYEPLER